MKVLFSADEHLYLRKKRVPKDWQEDRFYQYIDFMQDMYTEHLPNLVVHGGDFFDKYPTLEELAVFIQYVSLTKYWDADVFMIDGNHEAAKGKGNSWLPLLGSLASNINPKFQILNEPTTFKGINFLPYRFLKTKYEFPEKASILVTHVRGEIPPHVKPEVDLTIFDSWDIVFAGDLHAHSNSQRNIVYPGSPMTTEFHKNLSKKEHGVIVFDTEDPKNYTWIETGLPQLLKITVQTEEDIPNIKDEHFRLYEVENTLDNLANVKVTNNVVKKVKQEDDEVTLLLHGASSVEEELKRYLQKVMKIEETEEIIKFFHDYVAST